MPELPRGRSTSDLQRPAVHLDTFLNEIKENLQYEFTPERKGQILDYFVEKDGIDRNNPKLDSWQRKELLLHILTQKFCDSLTPEEKRSFLAHFHLNQDELKSCGVPIGLIIEAANNDDELLKYIKARKLEVRNKEFEFQEKLLESWYKFTDDLLNKGFKDLYKFDILEIVDSAFIYYIQRLRSKEAYERQKIQLDRSNHQKMQDEREQKEGEKTATWLKKTTGGGIYANDDNATIHATALNAILWHIAEGPKNGWRSLTYAEARKLPNNYFETLNTPPGEFEKKLKTYIEQTFKDKHPNLDDPEEFRHYATLAFSSSLSLYGSTNAHVQMPDAVVKRFFKKVKDEINPLEQTFSILEYWKAKGIQKTAASDAFWTKIRSDIASPKLDSQIKWADLAKYHLLDGSFYDYRNKEAQKIQKALEAGKLDEKMIKILRTKYFAKDEFNLKYNPYAGGMYNKIMPLYNKLQKPARDRVAQQYAAQNVNAI